MQGGDNPAGEAVILDLPILQSPPTFPILIAPPWGHSGGILLTPLQCRGVERSWDTAWWRGSSLAPQLSS